MTFKEVIEKQKEATYGRIKRISNPNEEDYIVFDKHLTALNKNGTLKTFTEEELAATDWEIY